jgi:thymidylate synthase (FAD)
MIEKGVCPEQARMILPQSMLTEWIWTGSLYAWSRLYRLRVDSHAQAEVQVYAHLVGAICSKHFPLSWNALTGDLT